jgi:CubicO group peptidase (beta-lactamase class C family)
MRALAFLLAMPLAAEPPAGWRQKVDQVFAAYDRKDSPGCALGILQDGQFLYQRGYGMANLEYGIPLDARSVFDIGSTSKQVVALSILLLEKDGKLSLDDPLRKHVPGLPDYGKPLTVRHALQHTSGLRDYLTLFALAGRSPDDYYTDPEVVEMLARQKRLNFEPGAEFLYSNSGYFLMSEVVKRVSGLTLRQFARQRIFEPLGMKATHFHDDHTEITPQRATGYAPRSFGGFRISMSTLDMVGDGGVYTSVEDLAKWDENFHTGRVGGADLLARMQVTGKLANGKVLDYALGLSVEERDGLRIISHGGSWAGFRAELLRLPQHHFAVICLCNLAATNPTLLARKIAAVFYVRAEPAPAQTPRREAPAAAAALSAGQLNGFAGTYYSDELDARYALRVEGTSLRLKTGRREVALEAAAPDALRAGAMELSFSADRGEFTVNAGRVRGIRFVRGR